MALRKWSWFCLTMGLLSMNGFSRYALAASEESVENRTPAISAEFHGLSPSFVAWLDQFDDRLEKILNVYRVRK